jgi:hypothetical protein
VLFFISFLLLVSTPNMALSYTLHASVIPMTITSAAMGRRSRRAGVPVPFVQTVGMLNAGRQWRAGGGQRNR